MPRPRKPRSRLAVLRALLSVKARLPAFADRLALGNSGLEVSPVCLGIVGRPKENWRATPPDHYRFALRPPQVDGILCSFHRVEHVSSLRTALAKGPLSEAEAEYLKNLCALAAGSVELAPQNT